MFGLLCNIILNDILTLVRWWIEDATPSMNLLVCSSDPQWSAYRIHMNRICASKHGILPGREWGTESNELDMINILNTSIIIYYH